MKVTLPLVAAGTSFLTSSAAYAVPSVAAAAPKVTAALPPVIAFLEPFLPMLAAGMGAGAIAIVGWIIKTFFKTTIGAVSAMFKAKADAIEADAAATPDKRDDGPAKIKAAMLRNAAKTLEDSQATLPFKE